jgi:hypothetical protein
MAKIKRYTEGILVRLTKRTKADLIAECEKINLEQAIYGRKAIEYCLKNHLIDHK